MAVIHVTASETGLRLRGPDGEDGGAPAADAFARALDRVPHRGAVAALIHGFRFDPASRRHDPHRLLFDPHDPACWPRRMGFTPDGAEDGLCIGFGWDARGGAPAVPAGGGRGGVSSAARRLVPGLGFAAAYARAAEAGAQLGRLIRQIHALRPDLRVDMLAHSLGARIALHAAGAPGAGRAILLGAAVHAAEARALTATQHPSSARAEGAQVINVISRRNDLFDALFEAAAPPPPCGAPGALGREGLGLRRRRWIDLDLDGAEFEAWLAARGHALGAARRSPCHWGFYARSGALELWSGMLRRGWTPESLRRDGAPEGAPTTSGATPPRTDAGPHATGGLTA